MSNLRTILEELVKEITMQPFLSMGAKDKISQAEQKIKELLLGEEEINLKLWEASNKWHNTHAENENGYIKNLAHAIHSAMLKKMEI